MNEGEGCVMFLIMAALVFAGGAVGHTLGATNERAKWCKQAYVTATASDSLRLQRVDECPLVTP